MDRVTFIPVRVSKTAQVSAFCLAMFFLIATIIAPWGEFPLNDDWQYVHIAKRFAETGRFIVDLPVAPTLFIQSVLGAGIIKLFGFSFLKLRVLTVVLAGGLLVLLASLMRLGGARRSWICLVLLCLIVNPLFLHLSQSFMTEVYGALVAFFGVWLWFRSESSVVGRMLAALVMGSSFWVRQFAVMVFPALLVAESISCPSKKSFKSAWAWSLVIFSFLLPILLYFPWAKQTGNYNPAFALQLERLVKPALGWGIVHALILVFYLTAFLFPVLLAVAVSRNRLWASMSCSQRKGARWLIGLLVIISIALIFRGDHPFQIRGPLHKFFPFLANVINPFGLGPITLSDTYTAAHLLLPSFRIWPWVLVQVALIGLSWVWVPLFGRLNSLPNIGKKLVLFGLVLAVLNLAACVQAYGMGVYDRYHFLGLLGVVICVAVLAGPSPAVRGFFCCLAVLALMGAWVIPAQHDYFAWNRARWTLLDRAERLGISAELVDGGFEVNGWLSVEQSRPNQSDPDCGISQYWFCSKRPYQIAISPTEGRRELMRERVNSWIGNFPDLLLTGP